MKIEVLFPEICNLYGELGNVEYLKRSIPDAEIIETSLTDTPAFISEPVDLVYMGTMTESSQELVIVKLNEYKETIIDRIEEGMNFLITGNALEIWGGDFYEEGQKVYTGLKIFDFESRRKARHRYNCLYVGDFKASAESADDPLTIVGFKSIFGFAYGEDLTNRPFLNTRLGYGSNKEIKLEGIHYKNFFATYITGPLLVLNPPFMEWFMHEKLGIKDAKPAYYKEAMDAYNYRVEEYTRPGKGWEY